MVKAVQLSINMYIVHIVLDIAKSNAVKSAVMISSRNIVGFAVLDSSKRPIHGTGRCALIERNRNCFGISRAWWQNESKHVHDEPK